MLCIDPNIFITKSMMSQKNIAIDPLTKGSICENERGIGLRRKINAFDRY